MLVAVTEEETIILEVVIEDLETISVAATEEEITI
jgi:hypothetical protein